jgi:hypothetical protein
LQHWKQQQKILFTDLERMFAFASFSSPSFVLRSDEIPSFGGSDLGPPERFDDTGLSPDREKTDEQKIPRKFRRST